MALNLRLPLSRLPHRHHSHLVNLWFSRHAIPIRLLALVALYTFLSARITAHARVLPGESVRGLRGGKSGLFWRI